MHLAVARPHGTKEVWYVLSDEPTDGKTLEEYGLRVDIEENFLDDKSNGFPREASVIRDAQALHRLCLVVALTTLYLLLKGVKSSNKASAVSLTPIGFGAVATCRLAGTG